MSRATTSGLEQLLKIKVHIFKVLENLQGKYQNGLDIIN